MRLWHYELVRVLPDAQLISQWRELCAIASRINKIGYPNHLLANKVMYYSAKELIEYSNRVTEEMYHRGIKMNPKVYDRFYNNVMNNADKFKNVKESQLGQYKGWHNDRYYWQCYHNLQEKYDCGGINEREWTRIQKNRSYFARISHYIMTKS